MATRLAVQTVRGCDGDIDGMRVDGMRVDGMTQSWGASTRRGRWAIWQWIRACTASWRRCVEPLIGPTG
eukprot:8898097-Pyramimonas_sp.AAC.1